LASGPTEFSSGANRREATASGSRLWQLMYALPRKRYRETHLGTSAGCQSCPNSPQEKSAWFTRRIGRGPRAQRGSTAPRARAHHAAGNLDNRHVRIVCAALARVNVSVFYPPLTAPTGLGLLAASPAQEPLYRAARGSVFRKMACRPAAGEGFITGSRPSTRARGGSLVAAPF
jgi:hypothetical protein